MDFSRKPKRENPRKGANLISRLFYLWLLPLFWNGMRNGLTTQDLTKCLQIDKSEELSDNLEREWHQELRNASKNKRKPKLWRALFRIHALNFVAFGFGRFIDIMLRTMLSVVLAQFLIQFQKPTDFENVNQNVTAAFTSQSDHQTIETSIKIADEVSMSFWCADLYRFAGHVWNDASSLATLIALMTFIGITIQHHGFSGSKYQGARMRIACTSLMYRKSIRLSASCASGMSTGHLLNLMSNDAARMDMGLLHVHCIWILPIQSLIVGYLIWQRVRWAAIIGVTCLLLKTVPAQTYLGHYLSSLRRKVAFFTDTRIGKMNEIIQGIQVIKMYAWEIPFKKIVAQARRMEIKRILYASYAHHMSFSPAYFVGRSTLFISILVCVLIGQPISADTIFSLAQYFFALQHSASFYPLALLHTGEAFVSMKRIEDFLLKEEMESGIERHSSAFSCADNANAIELNDLTASWNVNSNSETLSKINLKINSGKLWAVVGPVASGKSSLIQLLLGELPVQSGNVIVNGSISYAAQEPWIFSGTVRNNILFGQSYDRKRYNEVVQCCALATDFEQLPNGDKTFVGDRGASLSGGQCARISLARSMYRTASIYLLDDPLSAVDAHVGKHLFDEMIGPRAQIAEKTTRILVTHQVHLLKEADVIIIMENGRITHRGTYAELLASDIDFAKLLQENDQKKNKDENPDDKMSNEVGNVYEVDECKTDFDDTSNVVRYRPLKQCFNSVSKLSMASQELDTINMQEEEPVKGSFSWRMLSHYFSVGSSCSEILFLIFVLLCTQCMISGTDYYVKYFTYQEFQRQNGVAGLMTQIEYLYIYGALIIGLIFICIFRGNLFVRVCGRSSKALHDKMFDSILHAPMHFFDSNPSGRILNRVSADMGLIDDSVPTALVNAIAIMSNMCGVVILIIIINPTMSAAFAIGIVLFGLITKFYLQASQDLKRLEGICRSPILSHLTATMDGLTTIRAGNIQQELCREFNELQDVHSSVSQMSVASIHAYGYWMDCVSILLISCVMYSYIFLFDGSFSGNIGLAVSQAFMIADLAQYGIRHVVEAMQQMTSVERVIQYAAMEPEHSPSRTPPAGWPSNGNVQFENVSLRYDPEGESTLKEITLEIQSGSKIGVVGRTGAGKSSLIAALFRLTHIEGVIQIDGIDTKTISLACLRSKISIIPQNPVLFAGSLRMNVDPFEEYTDNDIWLALENVQMKEVISLTEGLNMPVMANGSNFSVGQRQLLCLARAILRKNRILVLDEATANVDPQTDQLIQQTIRKEFADCTVVTIAHRPHTIIDSDRVLVMDAGKCVEFDTPFNLLSIEGGIFRKMVEALGDKEYDRLYKISCTRTEE